MHPCRRALVSRSAFSQLGDFPSCSKLFRALPGSLKVSASLGWAGCPGPSLGVRLHSPLHALFVLLLPFATAQDFPRLLLLPQGSRNLLSLSTDIPTHIAHLQSLLQNIIMNLFQRCISLILLFPPLTLELTENTTLFSLPPAYFWVLSFMLLLMNAIIPFLHLAFKFPTIHYHVQ